MLTLTNGICKLLVLTCDNLCFKTHVKDIARLGYRNKSCSSRCVDIKLTDQFRGSRELKPTSPRKRLKIKIPPFTDELIAVPMGDSVQPTPTHVSFGGQFDISAEEESSEWLNSDDSGSPTDSRGRAPRSVPSDFRVWDTVGKKCDRNDGSTFKFRVVSYNVLAQYLLECHPYLYTECRPRNLKWKVRAARIYDEITNLAPDIICLQEVQASHLDSFYSKFEKIGYFGLFKQKTGHRQDGCAIYFKKSLFELQDHVSVEFYQPELPILNRDNIGMMVKLSPLNSPSTPIVVATTHLLFNPKRTDVRLAQVQVLLAELDRFAYHTNGRESGHHPIILTGDLNSTPDSAVIQLLDNGQVSAGAFRVDSSDWQRIGVTDNCQHLSVYLNRQQGRLTDFSNVKIYHSDYSGEGRSELDERDEFSGMFNSDVVAHPLRLASVYDKAHPEEKASTFQDYWVTVDYIYFSVYSSLRLVERLRLPSVSECSVLGNLPNDVYGSDHLALAATFELKPYKSAL